MVQFVWKVSYQFPYYTHEFMRHMNRKQYWQGGWLVFWDRADCTAWVKSWVQALTCSWAYTSVCMHARMLLFWQLEKHSESKTVTIPHCLHVVVWEKIFLAPNSLNDEAYMQFWCLMIHFWHFRGWRLIIVIWWVGSKYVLDRTKIKYWFVLSKGCMLSSILGMKIECLIGL